MPALGSYCKQHIFNAFSYAATNIIGGLIIKSGISLARTDNKLYPTRKKTDRKDLETIHVA